MGANPNIGQDTWPGDDLRICEDATLELAVIVKASCTEPGRRNVRYVEFIPLSICWTALGLSIKGSPLGFGGDK